MQNSKILVVEDSKMVNQILTSKLEEFGYEVDSCYTIKSAKESLEKNNYTLVLLDLYLPDGVGYELINDIHDITDTKVIVLTSTEEEQLREELFKYGIVDYIIKDKNFMYSVYEIHKTLQKLKLLSNRKILTIDDSIFITKQIKTVLEPRNYIVYLAKTANDGFEILKKEDIDLIVLDLELPDIHGLDVLEKIRRNVSYFNIPIIVLSGHLSHDIIRKILKSGGNDFIKKPFVVEEFILKVDLLVENAQKEKSILEKAKKINEINSILEERVSKAIKELREKDIMMFHQSRLAQMGEMLSMIAHQWRQPLNAIASANTTFKLQTMMDKIDKDNIMKLTNNIEQYIKHLSGTIDDFREFFKPKKQMQKTSLNELVNSSLMIIKQSLDDKSIKLIVELNSQNGFVSYANELKQVILNLIKNAEDVLIERKVDNPTIIIKTYEENGEYILEISDNAGGIPEEIKSKIFDPYFSTKSQKDGTGLGLYMSRIIVKDHCKGKIEVKNHNGGALFKITLKDLAKESGE